MQQRINFFVKGRVLVAFYLLLPIVSVLGQQQTALRPPAVPLVTHDPYFSVWSMRDQLTDERTKHWTGASNGMVGMLRIDGKPYRLLGQSFNSLPPLKQVSLEVLPTRTLYRFEADGVRLSVTFTSPLLPNDLEVMSRPVTYVTFDAQAIDGRTHQVVLYFDCTAEWAVNSTEQKVFWSRPKVGDLRVLALGSQDQAVLEKFGDDLRIDWGYLYLVLPNSTGQSDVIAWNRVTRGQFASSGTLPDVDDLRMPRAARDELPVLASTLDLGSVSSNPVSRYLILAYDDLYSVEYFKRKLRPFWHRDNVDTATLLRAAVRDYDSLKKRCEDFDAELMADLRRIGGEEYAQIAALAFRQTIAAHKLVADWDGTPLFFSKENFSNGSIDTVDVTYPSSPFFLLFNPQLLKAQLKPVLDYARSPRWKFPFAPHDLGTYPLANGQTYGGGEKTEENQMPVEESGNMLLMMAALTKAEGNAKFAAEYWPLLSKWAEYLREKGMDPENQLSTDDFAGHLAHNTNLSLKAILALGSYAMLCEMLDKKAEAMKFTQLTKGMVDQWTRMANEGDHYRLAFDKPGTWSQKYNLVWDRLLALNLFPAAVPRREIAYYKTKQNRYGIPLDNRESYTKLDWVVWTATLTEAPEDFRLFIAPVYRFVNETPSRVPLTDWYDTIDGKQRGFQARSVVGGVYVKMLSDGPTWKKWRSRSLHNNSTTLNPR